MSDTFPGSGRSRLLGLGVLIVTFIVGALAGAAVTRVVSADQPSERVRAEARERRERDADRRLFERLNLTPEQQASVDSIFELRRVQMKNFWDRHGPDLRVILDSTRAEMRSLLTPEQRAEEERLWAEHQERKRERRHD